MIELKRMALKKLIQENNIEKPILLPFPQEELLKYIFDEITDNEGNKYYRICSIIRSIISKIDFSNIPFENVYLSDENLSNTTGISFNPQTIYLKSLKNAILGEKVKIKDDNALNIKDLFDGVKIENTDFNGCQNVFINPQTILDKDLSNAKLKGVTFTGSFDGVKLWSTDFKGSINAKINPNRTKHLDYCNLNDVILLDLCEEGKGLYQAKNFDELVEKKDQFSKELYELLKDQIPEKKEAEPVEIPEPPKAKRKWFNN